MKRYSFLAWSALVSCGVSGALAACGGDDDIGIVEPATDAGRTDGAALDASGTDGGSTGADTGLPDATAPVDAGSDANPTDSGTDSGSDSGVDGGVDSGTDSGTDAGDSGTDAGGACGKLVSGDVVSVLPQGLDVVGVTSISYEGCAGSIPTAANPKAPGVLSAGAYTIPVNTEKNGYFRITGANIHPTIVGVVSKDALPFVSDAVRIPVQPAGNSAPGYDATKAHVMVYFTGASNGCTKNGNMVKVTGHDEGVVKYLDKNGVDVGSSNTLDGLVFISGLTPGSTLATLTITPSVAGCALQPGLFTGEVPLLADTVTTVLVSLGK